MALAASVTLFAFSGIHWLSSHPIALRELKLEVAGAKHLVKNAIFGTANRVLPNRGDTTGRERIRTIAPDDLTRMAIIQHQNRSFQVLGIRSGTALTERRVVVRGMNGKDFGHIKEFAAGERMFGGPLVESIGTTSVQVLADKPVRRIIKLNEVWRH